MTIELNDNATVAAIALAVALMIYAIASIMRP